MSDTRPELDFAWPLLPAQRQALLDAFYRDKRVFSGYVRWEIVYSNGVTEPFHSNQYTRRVDALRAAIQKHGDSVKDVRLCN
ncbi:TPA: hypothetical protein JG832_002513 [Enterobacter hormaechei subsp. xiangfangensis]|nr:hypothetical protein [Enterobacter hormaechei subsp. xiangfangensis]HAV1890648.1 hypothetical protein [Enterobacter hormaechei subsp. xiangfangensis]